ncbi:hypothetical protein SBV1_170028 [Verrucomicrobia bacterium]|nr:hypothetical protein SBV1_170028 [Verrucomicrobiota bacterium]
MSLWRTMSGAKPYLLLMNTDYDVFTSDLVERYFQRSLFYGMFPGMFSHNAADHPYWQNPKWYERDRPLFKKYLPLIKRIAEAGWQPITNARCDNEKVFVERFGPNPADEAFLTLFNDSETHQRTRLDLDLAGLGFNGMVTAREMISGKILDAKGDLEIELEPQQAEAIELKPNR